MHTDGDSFAVRKVQRRNRLDGMAKSVAKVQQHALSGLSLIGFYQEAFDVDSLLDDRVNGCEVSGGKIVRGR
jgi:hypothetical protein